MYFNPFQPGKSLPPQVSICLTLKESAALIMWLFINACCHFTIKDFSGLKSAI
jgi:hypothetical protein